MASLTLAEGAEIELLVAFLYLGDNSLPVAGDKSPLTKELLRKARICQDKGGVWINARCVIKVD